MNAGQEFVQVTKMVLAELAGGVANRLQNRGNGYRLSGQADFRSCLAYRGHAGADRQFAGDEVRTARRATRLGVIVGKQHALLGEFVEVRRPAGHQAAVVGPDVPHADVVAHDDDDLRFLRVGCLRKYGSTRVRIKWRQRRNQGPCGDKSP
jgi:hypothetical protein